MKKLTLILIAISILFAASNAIAYQKSSNAISYEKGDYELTLGGSGSNDEHFDGTVLNMEAGLGYFMTPNFEAVWRQGISYADVPGDDDWNGSTRISFDYNFDMRTWYPHLVPYLGVNIGYLYGDSVEEQFIAGPELGAKFFVNDTTFINAGIEYQFLFEDANDADDNFDDGRFVYLLGIGFKF